MDQVGNENVYPAMHAYLALIWCMALNDTMGPVKLVVTWSEIATFLNSLSGSRMHRCWWLGHQVSKVCFIPSLSMEDNC